MIETIQENNHATVNYSILEAGFKPADIYRFWCLSLYRDKWYNVHVTLEDIKMVSGDRSLGSFNDHFKEYLNIKPYYVKHCGHPYPTKRNVYHIPYMELECITISAEFADVELEAKLKGFYIQLVLLERYGNMELTKPNIIKALKMDKKTYDKYLLGLMGADLVKIGNPIKPDTSRFILENDFKHQKVTSQRVWREIAKEVEEFGARLQIQGISNTI